MFYALKYLFPPEFIGSVTGTPTAFSALPLSDLIHSSEKWVWETNEKVGHLDWVKGLGLKPIHNSLPLAVSKDRELYEYFSLIDAVRAGKAREIILAKKELTKRIESKEVLFG